MAGLLGDSLGDPKTQAVMSMAAGLLGGGNFGQALGRGLGGYQSVMGAANEAERQKQSDAMVQEQLQWKRDDRSQAQAQQQQRQQALVQLQQAMTSGQVTGQELLKLGLPMDLIKEAMTVKDMGRAEVARTVDTEGPDGSKMVQQFDKFGRPIGQGVAGYTPPVQVNLGDRIGFAKPTAGQSFALGMSPDAKASNALGWANNANARQRLAFDMAGGAEAVNGGKPQFKDGNWVMPPKAMQPGSFSPAMPSAGVKDANEALAIIDQAEKIIPNATGSYFGALADQGARLFGKSTEGDLATGKLQALEGALVSKMPKMSGPQSDKDVALYKQMAGVIGDPTIPVERKMEALKVVKEMMQRHAGVSAPQPPSAGSLGSGSFKILSVE